MKTHRELAVRATKMSNLVRFLSQKFIYINTLTVRDVFIARE